MSIYQSILKLFAGVAALYFVVKESKESPQLHFNFNAENR